VNAEKDEEMEEPAGPTPKAPVARQETKPMETDLPEVPDSGFGDDWRLVDDTSENGGPAVSPE